MFDTRKQLKKCDSYKRIIIERGFMNIKTNEGLVLPVYYSNIDGDDNDDENEM
jgi:hypothetical protein